jgi:hypothetical protein
VSPELLARIGDFVRFRGSASGDRGGDVPRLVEFARRIPHLINHLHKDQFIEQVPVTFKVSGVGWNEQSPGKITN